jgi:SAM-dependent methyltransferase
VCELGSFKGLKIIEVGGGAGTCAALAARLGSEVTVLDFSERALRRSALFFERHSVSAAYLRCDAMALPEEILGRFDVAMSFGFAEHFQGEERTRALKAHVDLVRPGGLVFVSVPNRWNLPYLLFRFFGRLSGNWTYGEEFPFSPRQLRHYGRDLGLTGVTIFADSLWASFELLVPLKLVRWLRLGSRPVQTGAIRQERGSPLDRWLSYAVVLSGRKPLR